MQISRYELVRELGRGGMGIVYEARLPGDPRRFALKLIPKELADTLALARFEREAKTMSLVVHPGVVKIHALERTPEGNPYLVTDLVEGENLKDLRRAGPLEPRRVAQLVCDLALAVAAVHAAGVLHRDLKPENVIVRPDGTPVLLDFGLAREQTAQSLTRSGAVSGTPGYMAPEQASGERGVTDVRTDVYGLGGVLFHLLAGHAPFEGPLTQVLFAVLEKAPAWPGVDANIPEGLLAIGKKALEKEPANRPATAAELAALLDGWLRGDAPAPRSRRRVVAALTVAAVGALALGSRVAGRGGEVPAKPAIPPPSPVASPAPPAPPSGTATRPPVPEMALVDEYLGLLERSPSARLKQLRSIALRFFRYPLPDEGTEAKTRVRFLDARFLLVTFATSGKLFAIDLEAGGSKLKLVCEVPANRGIRGTTSRALGGGRFDVRFVADRKGVYAATITPEGSAAVADLVHPLADVMDLNAFAVGRDGTVFVAAGAEDHQGLLVASPGKTTERLDAGKVEALAVDVSTDGRVVLVGGEDEAGKIPPRHRLTAWDAGSRAELARPLTEAGVSYQAIVASPRHPRRFIVAASHNFMTIDAVDGELRAVTTSVRLDGIAKGAAFTRDGAFFYGVTADGATRNELTVFAGSDVTRPIRTEKIEPARSVDVSPDGKLLAIGRSDGVVEIWGAGDR